MTGMVRIAPGGCGIMQFGIWWNNESKGKLILDKYPFGVNKSYNVSLVIMARAYN